MIKVVLAAALILVTFFLAIGSTDRKSTITCSCWKEYRAKYTANEAAECVALNKFHIMPCNMPKAPKCRCSERVSSILKDRTGTWCTRFHMDEELKRWPCENTQEWDEFFARHPDFV